MFYLCFFNCLSCFKKRQESTKFGDVQTISDFTFSPLGQKSKLEKTSFRTIDRSLHDWALAGRLGHNPPESHHRPIPPKLREISSVGRGTVGPADLGQNCPAITSTSLKSLKLQTKLKRNTKFFFVLVSKNSCKVPHPEIVNAIYSWVNYVWMSIRAPWWQTQTKDETGKLAEKA